MRKVIMSVAAGAAAVLAVAGPVFADKTFVDDPAGDSQGNNIDIIKMKAGHGVGDVLKHRATFAKKVNPNDVAPNLVVIAERTPYTITPAGNGSVVDAQGNTVARAEVVPVGDNGFKYKFREKAIGNPKHYRWAFTAVDEHGAIVDRAPDAGWVKHRGL